MTRTIVRRGARIRVIRGPNGRIIAIPARDTEAESIRFPLTITPGDGQVVITGTLPSPHTELVIEGHGKRVVKTAPGPWTVLLDEVSDGVSTLLKLRFSVPGGKAITRIVDFGDPGGGDPGDGPVIVTGDFALVSTWQETAPIIATLPTYSPAGAPSEARIQFAATAGGAVTSSVLLGDTVPVDTAPNWARGYWTVYDQALNDGAGGLIERFTDWVQVSEEPAAETLVAGEDFIVDRTIWSPTGQTATFTPIMRFPGLLTFDAIEYSASALDAASPVWARVAPRAGEAGAYDLTATGSPTPPADVHLFTPDAARNRRLRFRWRLTASQPWSLASDTITVTPPAGGSVDTTAWLPTAGEVANAIDLPITGQGAERTGLFHYRVMLQVEGTGTEKQCIVGKIYNFHAPTVWALAAYAGDTRTYASTQGAWTGSKTAQARLIEQLEYWGNGAQTAPAGQSGYNAQYESGFVAAVTVARGVPAVWDALSATVKSRLRLAMLGVAVANAFVGSDTCPYTGDWGGPGSGGTNKRTIRGYTAGRNNAPNFSTPVRLIPYVAAQFFRLNGEDLQALFNAFNQAHFAALCAPAGVVTAVPGVGNVTGLGGLDHMHATFRRRWTNAVQREEHPEPGNGGNGGGPVGDGPTSAQILSAINGGGSGAWTCLGTPSATGPSPAPGIPLSEPERMFRLESERFFSATIHPGVPRVSATEWPGAENDGLGGTALYGIKGSYTNNVLRAVLTDRSIWANYPNAGLVGMARELNTRDGGGDGPSLRSSMSYVQQGFAAYSCLCAALLVTGSVEQDDPGIQGADGVLARVTRGVLDMKMRDEHGHRSYAKGGGGSTNNEDWNTAWAESQDRSGGGFRLASRYALARLGLAYLTATPSTAAPEYVANLPSDMVLQQGQSATLDLDTCFSGGNLSYSLAGVIPPGVSLSGKTLTLAPTGFRGRDWFTVTASNNHGSFSRMILLSVAPRKDVSPFDGAAWNPTYTFVGGTGSAPSTATLTGRSNVLIDAGNYTGGMTLIGCDNVLIYNTRSHSNSDSRDGIRLEQCGRVLIWDCELSGLRDGIKLAGGDWPASGPNIFVCNSYIHDCGNSPDPKEHGGYLHSKITLQGNILYNNMYGNALSMRSSGDIICNFSYKSYGAGISYFSDHLKSGAFPLNIIGNVIADAGLTDNDGDIILRDVSATGTRVDFFTIAGNYGTANRRLIDIRTGYTGVVAQSGNVTLPNVAAALAMFPATPWV